MPRPSFEGRGIFLVLSSWMTGGNTDRSLCRIFPFLTREVSPSYFILSPLPWRGFDHPSNSSFFGGKPKNRDLFSIITQKKDTSFFFGEKWKQKAGRISAGRENKPNFYFFFFSLEKPIKRRKVVPMTVPNTSAAKQAATSPIHCSQTGSVLNHSIFPRPFPKHFHTVSLIIAPEKANVNFSFSASKGHLFLSRKAKKFLSPFEILSFQLFLYVLPLFCLIIFIYQEQIFIFLLISWYFSCFLVWLSLLFSL